MNPVDDQKATELYTITVELASRSRVLSLLDYRSRAWWEKVFPELANS